MDELPFWRAKGLHEMSAGEWESLCDGCGRCCLHKLRDEDDVVHFTDVACHMLDLRSCQCRDYPRRQQHVPDCVALTPSDLGEIDWLPPSCAYRLVAEGRDLPAWHPLRSGDPDSVHGAGASVRGRAINERKAGALEDHVVTWPGRMPRPPRRAPVVRRHPADALDAEATPGAARAIVPGTVPGALSEAATPTRPPSPLPAAPVAQPRPTSGAPCGPVSAPPAPPPGSSPDRPRHRPLKECES